MISLALLKINGVDMPSPRDFTVKRSDLSPAEDGRTSTGKMIKNIVSTKTTLSCSWSVLSWAQCSKLLQAVEKDGAFFDVTYPDPYVNAYVTKKFYVGDRTAPALMLENGKEKWEGVSFDFIEQ